MLIPFIPGDAGGMRIQHRFAVHQKPVLMMPVTQFDASGPPTVHGPLHGERSPLVEIAHEFHRPGARRRTIKVDRLE